MLLTPLLCVGCAAAKFAWAQPAQTVDHVEDPEYTVQFAFESPGNWPQEAEIRILFDTADSGTGHALVVGARRCYFAHIVGGKLRAIGSGGVWQAPEGLVRGVLQRRHSRMVALLNYRQLATAYDPDRPGGEVAWSSTHESLKLSDIHVQPVARVEFGDDFVREGDSLGDWEALMGNWGPVGPKGARPRPDLSANPFSFRAQAGPADAFALSAAGDWFWNDYRVTAAVKPEAAGAIGLAAYVQDAENFFVFRWTGTGEMREGAYLGRQQLLRVLDGQWSVLADRIGGFWPDRWYQVSLAVCDGLLQAMVDGQVVLQARDTSFGQGRIGLFAQNIPGASFDDVTACSIRMVSDDFTDGDLEPCAIVSGQWECRQGHLYGIGTGSKPAEVIAGDRTWRDYVVSASVKAKAARAVGLLAYRNGSDRTYLFRWEASGRQSLVLVMDGRQTVLAETKQPLDPARFYRLDLEARDGRLAASVDGRMVLEAADTNLVAGPCGLLVEGGGEACFDDVSAVCDEHQPPAFTVTAQFTREETMQNWVDPSRQWRQGDDGVLWYDLPLFGDFTLWLPEMDLGPVEGDLEFLIAPQPQRPAALPLHLSTRAGASAVTGRIAYGEATLAQGQAEATGVARLRVVRRGSVLSAWLDEQPIVSFRDSRFLGRGLGLRIRNMSLDLSETMISSPHLVDVTFSGAPTDWAPELGIWEVTDRWPCYPGWSWFGGSKHESPLLWSKDTLEGDQVLQFWAALLMDLPSEPGYSHPSDINAILCGDGTNLCSGYSFILAGDNNTKSKVLKGNTVVAENPDVKFENPVSMNLAFQRHWFDIRIEKMGNHLTYSVDGRVVAEWDDPHVLKGGKVGFWSYQNNGILIARARMAAETIRR